jgi:hypothetical protein
MILHRLLLRLLPAVFAGILLVALPAGAEQRSSSDTAVAANDGVAHNLAPPKPADHASRRQHRSASFDQFVEVDDDAEQDFKPLTVAAVEIFAGCLAIRFLDHASRETLLVRRLRSYFPTGPPHA